MIQSESITTGAKNTPAASVGSRRWLLQAGSLGMPALDGLTLIVSLAQVLCGCSSSIAAIFVAILTLLPHLVCGSRQIPCSLVMNIVQFLSCPLKHFFLEFLPSRMFFICF